jgi:uridine kinase
MNYIIAVASIIGGGKTSLVKAIAERLNNAPTIHYDHYERMTGESVDNLLKWMSNGSDFNDFVIPNLPEHLESLKMGESVIDPLTGIEIRPNKYIIFEMPLGKEHRLTAAYIDLLIWIEIPFDVALGRKMKEFTSGYFSGQVDHRERIIWLDRYLDNYLRVVRNLLKIQKEKVSVNADIIINGEGDFETRVQEVMDEIFHRIPQ